MQSLIGQLLGLSNVVMQIDVTKKEREDEELDEDIRVYQNEGICSCVNRMGWGIGILSQVLHSK